MKTIVRILAYFLIWIVFWGIYYVFVGFPTNTTAYVMLLISVVGLAVAMETLGDYDGYTRGYEAGFSAGAEHYREAVYGVIDKTMNKCDVWVDDESNNKV